MERQATGLKLELGDQIPYFSLPATDGKIYSVKEFSSKSVLVIIFTSNYCPYTQAYETRICKLAQKFVEAGVQFVTICSNDSNSYPEDGFDRMVEKSRSLDFLFPYLQDESQIAARAFDAACTPECYVFDQKRKLRYHGRIDDNYEDESSVQKPELQMAIEAILKGEEPNPALTQVIGCSIKWKLD